MAPHAPGAGTGPVQLLASERLRFLLARVPPLPVREWDVPVFDHVLGADTQLVREHPGQPRSHSATSM